MSGEIESHAETESEDGGVTLLIDEFSNEAIVGCDFTPPSASQSPLRTASSLSSSSATAHSSLSMDTVEQALSTASESDGISLANDSYMLSLVDSDLYDTVGQEGIDGVPGLSQWSSQPPQDHDIQAEEVNADSVQMPNASAQLTSHAITADLIHGAVPDPEYPHHGFPDDLTDHDSDATGNNSPLPQAAIHLPVQNWNSQLDAVTENFLQSMPAFSLPNDDSYMDWPEDLPDYWDETEESIRNFHSDAFFSFWKVSYVKRRPGYPYISDLSNNIDKVRRPDRISADLVDPDDPDAPDLQGIHWSRFQTTKEDAREVRRMTYTNHINEVPDVDYSARLISNQGIIGTPAYKMKFSDEAFPKCDRHFDFRETNTQFKSYISHFQLRHTIFASSKNALFYIKKPRREYGYGAWNEPGSTIDAKISCFNPQTSTDECVMDLSKRIENDPARNFRPSTLNAANGVLTVGSFEGSYAIKSLAATFETRPTISVVTDNGIESSTNHIQNFLDRISGLPQAAFSSNDKTIRILDCTTNKFVKVHHFPYLVNCSAISPDGRLRLLVGDECYPIVANADTGEVITKLNGHTNYGFACDWAPDGVTMATGHQDGFVNVWDARHMTRPIYTIPMEQAGSRTLQFSPLGSGKRLLVIAESGDFVHVVDARTFQSKQTIDFFGDIAGISMPPDGSALYIANQDHKYGGLMEFERNWTGIHQGSRPSERMFKHRRPSDGKILRPNFSDEFDYGTPDSIGRLDMESRVRRRELTFDWLEEGDMDDNDSRVLVPRVRRQGRGLLARDVEG